MSSISLDNAWLLLIALPIVILIAVPFFIAIRKDNRNGHNIASGALHIVMAIIIAFAAAGVTVETTLTETDVFIVADVSYSSNRNLDVIDGYINDIYGNLPDNSQVGVICFGKEATMLTAMGGEFTSVKDAGLTEEQISQTDIANALEYAGERFKSGVIKRIVLITDAKQTGSSTDDDLKEVVDRLIAENVYIDAIYLDNNISDGVDEVQLSGIEASQTTYKGQQATAAVTVESSSSQPAAITLYDTTDGGNTEIYSRTVNLTSGTNTINFDLPEDRDEGVYTYTATVDAADDANSYNNSCSFTQEVVGEVKVLFITGDADDYAEAKTIFAGLSSFKLTRYLSTITTSVPYTVADISAYDIIILADIDVSTLDNYSMFVDSLEVAVSQLGKSLFAIGDLNLQNNTGDAALTKLENMLPVTYGNTVRDTKSYVLVMDCSYSMSINGKAQFAMEAAEAIVDLLNEDDILYIVKFYSENSVVYSDQVGDGSAAKAVIEQMTKDNTCQGTVISGGMNYVLNNIASVNYSLGYATSVLLITDGLAASDSDKSDTVSAASSLYSDYGITTNIIDVGNANADNPETETFLNEVAASGGGTHFYYTYNLSLDDILPTIGNEMGESIVEGVAPTVNVSYRNYNDSVLDGVKESGALADGSYTLSYIQGYVVSSAKSSATTVLTVSYTSQTSNLSKSVPLYSYWGYGNGNSAAFTTSLSGDWVAQWLNKGILETFIGSAVTTSIPEERVDTSYTTTINKDSDSYSLEITPVEIKSGAQVTVYLTGPDGQVTALTTVFDSSSYISSFNADSTGSYVITVEYVYKDTAETSNYYIDVSYLAEYDSFTLYEASLLYKVLGSDGTVSESGAFKIENDEDIISKSTASLTIPLLIAVVVLFAVDIAVRKLKWSDIVSLFRRVEGGRSKS